MTDAKKKIAEVRVDRELCISAASCVMDAPATFELDEQGIAVVKKDTRDKDDLIWIAAEGCPTNAILLYDESGEQIYPAP